MTLTRAALNALTDAHRYGFLVPVGREWKAPTEDRYYASTTVGALLSAKLLRTGHGKVTPVLEPRRHDRGGGRRWEVVVPRPIANDQRVARAVLAGARAATLDPRYPLRPIRCRAEVSTDASVLWVEVR